MAHAGNDRNDLAVAAFVLFHHFRQFCFDNILRIEKIHAEQQDNYLGVHEPLLDLGIPAFTRLDFFGRSDVPAVLVCNKVHLPEQFVAHGEILFGKGDENVHGVGWVLRLGSKCRVWAAFDVGTDEKMLRLECFLS